MGLRRFLRFLNSERGQLPASEAARFKRAEESFVQAPQPGGQGQTLRVYREGQVVVVTDPQVGEMVIDDAGFPIGRYGGQSLINPGQPRIDPLSVSEFEQFSRLLGVGTGTGQVSRSSSTSFNVSEVGPIAAQIQREQLEVERRRLDQERRLQELRSQIEIGQIDANTALTQYDQMLTAQRIRVDASEFAVAPGTEFAPGFEPGGLGSQLAESAGLTPQAGVAPIAPVTISTGTPPAITPLAEQPSIQQAFEALKNFGA